MLANARKKIALFCTSGDDFEIENGVCKWLARTITCRSKGEEHLKLWLIIIAFTKFAQLLSDKHQSRPLSHTCIVST